MTIGIRALGALALCLALTLSARAEITEADIVDPGPLNEDYLDATAGKRIQSGIVYLRPETDFSAAEADKLEIIVEPDEDPERPDEPAEASRLTVGLIFGALLVGLIALFVIYGGNIGASFGAQPRDGKRREDDEAPTAEEAAHAALMAQPIDSFLDTLRRMADRREVLILLVSRALERAATLNDLRLGRSQTARDVLRILPKSWTHLGNMRRLVREVEVVHFGGRDLPEEIWEECLDAARPIFGEQGRA